MIRGAIIKLSKKEDLTYQEAYECMNRVQGERFAGKGYKFLDICKR